MDKNYKEYRKRAEKETTVSFLKVVIKKNHKTDPKLAKYSYIQYKKKGGKLSYNEIVK